MRKIKKIGYSGSSSQKETGREVRNRKLSARAAADGMVLLENNGMLPLKGRGKIALYGSGARMTVMGGTGSGDVNERYSVNLEQGLENAGFYVTTKGWLDENDATVREGKKAFYGMIIAKGAQYQQEGLSFDDAMIRAYSESPAYIPRTGRIPNESDIEASDTDTAVFVIARNAGEGKDRSKEAGDYKLSVEEMESIRFLRKHYEKLLAVINCGGVMDLSFLDVREEGRPAVDALLIINQPGMEAGNAFAQILTGEVTPSGKLTDTWAVHYEDYPNSASFSYNSGDTTKEYYKEGIYVGYRYFDKADKTPRYPFGYGLSYTSFYMVPQKVRFDKKQVSFTVSVTNTGDQYSGKEVVQAYVTLPDGKLEKERKRLVAFGKTSLLKPGEQQDLTLSFQISDLASYEEAIHSYVMEAGGYGLYVGNSSVRLIPAAAFEATEKIVVQRVAPICPLQEKLDEISLSDRKQEDILQKFIEQQLPVFQVDAEAIKKQDASDADCHEKYMLYAPCEEPGIKEILDQMTMEQMAHLVVGVTTDTCKSDIGMSAVSVVGAAGETTSEYMGTPWNLANIILADGPAGLRLVQNYQLDPEGKPYPMSLMEQFMKPVHHEDGTDYYQYCTRMPSGSSLAQSFDLELVQQVGKAIAEEMKEFNVTLWLAPGMNIHRNPLCGRNFEYYSEDPYLSGRMAAAMTKGVQSIGGVGTTIKHFTCNNQEDNRQFSDSIVSERALREIYLKGFEIAVKEASPMALMTSYNLVNGIHAANNYDLCTNVLRREWGYEGMVMTDWNTTKDGGASAALCIKAGNDLIMPGSQEDIQEIIVSLESSMSDNLKPEELRACASRIIRTILASDRYENE